MSKHAVHWRDPVSRLVFLRSLIVKRPLLVIGVWIVAAVAVCVSLPGMTQAARDHQSRILPPDSPVMVAKKQMAESFGEPDQQNVLIAVLTREDGLRPADEGVYRRLADRLRQDRNDVAAVHDFIDTPAMRPLMASADHKAFFLAVDLASELGSAKSGEAYQRIGEIVE